jgi:hypothetical protein
LPAWAHITGEPRSTLSMEEMVQEEEAAALRCACGYGILCELRREGERLAFLAFFDNEPTSETYTEQVENCPGCGKQLGGWMLTLK